MKKIIIAGVAAIVLMAASTAYAFTTGPELNSSTSGETTYDEGIWQEFHDEMLKNKKAFLDEKVDDGIITQEEADEIYGRMSERQRYCESNGGMSFGGKRAARGCGAGWR